MDIKINGSSKIESSIKKSEGKNGTEIYKINLSWDRAKTEPSDYAEIFIEHSIRNITNAWLPNATPLGLPRVLKPEWKDFGIFSSIAVSAPVLSFYDNSDMNKLTVALSETKKHIDINYGPHEKNSTLMVRFRIPLVQYTDTDRTEIFLYIDETSKNIYDAVGDVVKWWESDIGIEAMPVPSNAYEPLYSFWYSYHQDVYENDVEKECQSAAEFGFKNVIIDDGWQTDDNNGGYAYCGDWEVCKNKISDFAAHVERVHKMGLKYILWYSVPFVGSKSKNWERFKNKILYFEKGISAGALDPRYAEVREFLISIYKNAIIEWNIDGFKLDFIDKFVNPDNVPSNDEMDIPDLQDAVDALMIGVRDELTAIKPNILIEFRQTYIGPNIRKYGNMLRAGDCPYDYMSNRVSVLDLRMSSGGTAVHSDMLMWSNDDTKESAAMQIINTIFSVVQISVKTNRLPDNHKEMLKFWVHFMDENKELLLNSKLKVSEPHMYYTSATAYDEKREITAVYSNGKCVDVTKADSIVINGSGIDNILCRFKNTGDYKIEILDCAGRVLAEKSEKLGGIVELNIPISGMARISAI